MNLLLRPLRTSVGSKYVMALTGLGLIGFVLVHMVGNLLIFLGRDALNAYAKSLEDKGALLWAARGGLLAIFLVHVVLGLRLTRQNQAARGTPYAREDTLRASWASRHMLLTGMVVLAFLIYHLLHFTFGVTDPENYKNVLARDSTNRPDVAEMVVRGFARLPVALGYVVAQVFLCLHLWHGGSSWFQSLGLNQPAYNPLLRAIGPGLALLVLVGNSSIPLAILLGWRPLP